MEQYEYHMNWAWIGGNFLLMFLPVARRYSLDRLRLQLRYSNARAQYQPPLTVSQLAYFVPAALLIGFVYFNSTLFKLDTAVWRHGLGLWKYATVPMWVIADQSWLLNQEWLVKFLSYLTLVFEILFIFLLPFKRWRPWLLIIGVGLHIGILIEFPIPLFALGYCAIYTLLVPAYWWAWLFGRRKAPVAPKLTIYYDGECPLCARTRLVLTHFDTRSALAFRTVQAAAAQEPALAGIAPADLLNTLYSVDRAGRVYTGLATYVRALSAIWYLKPLSWLLRVPGIAQVARRAYNYVAANRLTERCTDDNCGYAPPAVPKPDTAVRILHNLTLHDLKLRAVTLGLAALTILQIIINFQTPLVKHARRLAGVYHTTPDNVLAAISDQARFRASPTLGMANHGVFIHEIDDYNHLVAVTYPAPDGTERFLPITTPEGFAGPYCYAFLWARWGFRANAPAIDQEKLLDGIQDYSAFYAHKHGIDLANTRFNVKVKKIEVPHLKWKYNFLKDQIAKPWLDAGYVEWRDRKFVPHVAEVEKM